MSALERSNENNRFVRAQAEEVLIGGLLGAAIGLALVAPLAAGLPDVNPFTAYGFWGFLQAAVLWGGAAIGAGWGGMLVARQERDSHLRGAQYFPDFERARSELQKLEGRQFSSRQKAHEVRGIQIGGVELSRGTETGHIYAVGLPRSGKTVLLTSIIEQVLERGDRLVVHDPKGDFTARYFNPESCVLLGPWDERAAIWDASADIDSPALAGEFGASVAGKVEGQNKSFHDAAGRLIAGLIRSYQREKAAWSWSDLRSGMEGLPLDLVRRAVLGDRGIRSVMPSAFSSNPELTTGERAVLGVLGGASGWIANYASIDTPARQASRFSVRNWMLGEAHTNTRVVILNSNSLYETAGEAIFGAILATISAAVSSAIMPERSADAPGSIWYILDEFPQLGAAALNQVQRIAEVGRSRGMRIVTALQDEAQLAAKVGREKAAPMLAVQSTKVYMRSSDLTADSVAKRLGRREVNRLETTAENGALAGKTVKLVEQQVIQPSDLLGLHVRSDDEPNGVELILHLEDTLGRLVQSFPARRPDIAAPFLESEDWKRGSLPDDDEPTVSSVSTADSVLAGTTPTDDTDGSAVNGADDNAASDVGEGGPESWRDVDPLNLT